MTEQNIENGNTASGYGVSTPHPSPLPGRGGEGGGAQGTAHPTDGEKRTIRLPPVPVLAREAMTLTQLMEAQREHQGHIGLEAQVRRLAQVAGLEGNEVEQMARASWGGFRIVQGEPIPVSADRVSVVMSADGQRVLSVAEWVQRNAKLKIQNEKWDSREEEVLPMRNPFRRKTWNLTEQMRLQRRDPKLARRFKGEAYAEGDIKRI